MSRRWVLGGMLVVAPLVAGAQGAPEPKAAAAAQVGGPIDHAPFDALLKAHVKKDRVDYAGLAKDERLGRYVAALARQDPEAITDRKARLAFWINAYNALTLSGVLRHWPEIESVEKVAPDFGFFKAKEYTVGGKKYALNDIENEIIRPQFKDPRIHAALNCASTSCPPLVAHAFTGDKLDAQLDAVMGAFAKDRSRNAIDAATGTVKLSRIFEWYKGDFDAAGGVAAFLGRYLPPEQAAAVKKAEAEGKLQYLDYDWRLNKA